MAIYRSRGIRKKIKAKSQWALSFKTFRFLISGGTAVAVDISSYFVAIHYIFMHSQYSVAYFAIKAPYAALIFSFSCGFVTSFTLSKFFVFTGSEVRTRHQLMRFVGVAAITFVLNYAVMKVLIGYFYLFPTVARIVAAGMVSIVSFSLNNAFTFKVKGTGRQRVSNRSVRHQAKK